MGFYRVNRIMIIFLNLDSLLEIRPYCNEHLVLGMKSKVEEIFAVALEWVVELKIGLTNKLYAESNCIDLKLSHRILFCHSGLLKLPIYRHLLLWKRLLLCSIRRFMK